MERKRELTEIILDLKREKPGFNKEEILEYAKWSVLKLYNSLKDKEEIRLKCKNEVINKLNQEKSKYRITEKIDHLTIQYAELFDYEKLNNENYIKIYMSLYFYDNVKNNLNNKYIKDNFWNDIWIVTFRETEESENRNSNCVNCGATMKYDNIKNIFECEFCGNVIKNEVNSKWEIVDIELKNI